MRSGGSSHHACLTVTSGDLPSYDAPFIDMCGIPALPNQGEDVAIAEVEAHWDVTPRWSLLRKSETRQSRNLPNYLDNDVRLRAAGGAAGAKVGGTGGAAVGAGGGGALGRALAK